MKVEDNASDSFSGSETGVREASQQDLLTASTPWVVEEKASIVCGQHHTKREEMSRMMSAWIRF